MTSDLLEVLARVNLAAAAAILAVMAIRPALRRLAGSRIVYTLWICVPIAASVGFLPARKILATPAERPTALGDALERAQAGAAWPAIALGVWLAGAAAGLAWLAWRQNRFLADVGPLQGEGELYRSPTSGVGPALVGVLVPKIVVPSDFEARFTERERKVILAHERMHRSRGDAQVNAVVLLCECVAWFNPLIHLGARALRLDQELACDSAVLARLPKLRRTYVQAMWKSQSYAVPAPLGCSWPDRGKTAVGRRLAMLKRSPPGRTRIVAGAAAVALAASGAGLSAWAGRPVAYAAPSQTGTAAAAAPPAALVAPQRVQADHQAHTPTQRAPASRAPRPARAMSTPVLGPIVQPDVDLQRPPPLPAARVASPTPGGGVINFIVRPDIEDLIARGEVDEETVRTLVDQGLIRRNGGEAAAELPAP